MTDLRESKLDQVHYLEDSDDEVFLSRLLLESQKVEVELIHHAEFESLETTLSSRDIEQPILVLVDLNMPRIKGTKAIERITETLPMDNLHIGICSGSEDPADKFRASEVGAKFFVHKPLNAETLKKVCEVCDGLEYRETEAGNFAIFASAGAGQISTS